MRKRSRKPSTTDATSNLPLLNRSVNDRSLQQSELAFSHGSALWLFAGEQVFQYH